MADLTKKLNTKYSRVSKTALPNRLKRQAFLDTLYDEAMEKPYDYASFNEAITDLSSKFKVSLTLDELVYLKKKAKAANLTFAKLRAKIGN